MGVKIQKPGDTGHPGGNRRVYVRVNYRGHRKTRVFNSARAADTYASQVEAWLKIGKIEEVFTDPATIEPAMVTSVTFGAYWKQWFATEEPGWKPRTALCYNGMFETHLAYLENWPLTEITRNDLKHLLVKKLRGGHLKKIGKPMKPNSVKGILTPLRKCLQAAVDDNLIPANPASRVRVPQRKDQTAEDRIERYTREEIAHILAVAREQMPPWFPAILTAARTGLRVGELCGLRVEDINFAERFVHVRRTISRRIEGTPKSGKSRKVDMSAQLSAVLQDHIRSREIAATVAGKDPSPWVFGSLETGRYRNDEELAKGVWPRLLVLAGARPLKFHGLRHTFASLLLEQGESPAYVKEQLGHSSISITVDCYGHLIPGGNRAAVDKLDDPQEVFENEISRNPRATKAHTHS